MEWNKRAKQAAAILFWVAVWQFAAMAIPQKFLLASPLETLEKLAGLVPTAAFWQRVSFSALRILAGFFSALAAGVVLAAASAWLEPVRVLIRPLMQLIKAVPVASFIILALLWVRSANLAVLISFLMVLPVVYTAVLEGIQQTDRQLLEMAQVFRIPFSRALGAIWLPQVWPYFVQSCTVGMGLAWKSGIAAEVIGLPEGSLGEALYQAKIFLVTDEMFAWTLTVILASMAFEKLVMLVLRRLAARISGEEGRP